MPYALESRLFRASGYLWDSRVAVFAILVTASRPTGEVHLYSDGPPGVGVYRGKLRPGEKGTREYTISEALFSTRPLWAEFVDGIEEVLVVADWIE